MYVKITKLIDEEDCSCSSKSSGASKCSQILNHSFAQSFQVIQKTILPAASSATNLTSFSFDTEICFEHF